MASQLSETARLALKTQSKNMDKAVVQSTEEGLSPEEQGILALRDREPDPEEANEEQEEVDDEGFDSGPGLQWEAEQREEGDWPSDENGELEGSGPGTNGTVDSTASNVEVQSSRSLGNRSPAVEEDNSSAQDGENGSPLSKEPDNGQAGADDTPMDSTRPTPPPGGAEQSQGQVAQPPRTRLPSQQPQSYHTHPMAPTPAPYPVQTQPPAREPKTWKELWEMDRQKQAAQAPQALAQQPQGYTQGPPPPGAPPQQGPYPGPPAYQQPPPFPQYQAAPMHHLSPSQYYIPPSPYHIPPSQQTRRGRKVPKADLSYSVPRPVHTMSGPTPLSVARQLPSLAPAPSQPVPPAEPKPPRPPPRVYTDEQRQKVWDLHCQGLNHADIAAQTDVSHSTVPSILKRFRDRGGKMADNPRGGRQPKMRECDFKHLMLLIEKDPTLTARELKVLSGLDISVQTIERELEKREVERNPAKKRRKLLRAEREKAREEGRLVDHVEEEEEEKEKEEKEKEPKTWGDLYRILDPNNPPKKGARRRPGEQQSVRKALGYKN